MMPTLPSNALTTNRRNALLHLGWLCASLPSAWTQTQSACGLSIGTYGLQSWSLQEAIRKVSQAGFDGIEIAAMPGYPGDPERLSQSTRRSLRHQLIDLDLRLDAIMAGIKPGLNAIGQADRLERMKQCLELAQTLATPDQEPIVQTILGGPPKQPLPTPWIDELQKWRELAERSGVTISIKPHRGHLISRPRTAIQLLKEIGQSKRLRMVFDYSHFAFRDIPLNESIRTSSPWVNYVVLKDAHQNASNVEFGLPSRTNPWSHADLIRSFYDHGYRGSFCCEISSHVWNRPGYDPQLALETSHRSMASAFQRAGVARG